MTTLQKIILSVGTALIGLTLLGVRTLDLSTLKTTLIVAALAFGSVFVISDERTGPRHHRPIHRTFVDSFKRSSKEPKSE